jgi:multidrug resistance efflux pump
MTSVARASRVFFPLIMVAVAVALVSTAVQFSRMAAEPTKAPLSEPAPSGPVQEGVICFGTADLESGVASLYPLQQGRVTEVLVAENQAVAQGAELLRLDDGIARSRLGEAEAAVMLAQLQLQQARKQPELHRRHVDQQAAMRDAAESRVTAARRVLAREEKLAKTAVIPDSDRSISEEKIREMEALKRAEDQRLAELEAQDVEVGIKRAEFELKAAEARRDQARLSLEEHRVRAPRRGTVLRIPVAPGDVLGGQPGQPAILFAAEGPQVVRATVEQEFANRVKEGEPAIVRDEADPSASWRGRVSRMAGWYKQRRTVLHDPSELSDVRTLECVIVLDPGQPRLRLGQSVRITIGPVPP